MKANERKAIINQLQTLAKDVLELKDSHRQKRPIVIEFSGSPKSGKTSCINSLELFLKRNGFKVEIIQERASICPVSDKRSPMFNLWTACSSIAGMIGALERKSLLCDVLILDRGIFDACCWFEWLNNKKYFDNNQKEIVESFLLLDSLVNRIDIIFAFKAQARISIQREYANLLTDKPGSIMNITVLEEYLECIENTYNNKRKYFHNIFTIDTSNKNQDEVGKEVTTITLETLKDSLMEKIGYCELTNDTFNYLSQKRVFKFEEIRHIIENIKFDLREKVEQDETLLQPIPIAVLTNYNKDSVLLVKKTAKATSGNSPEKDKSLIYIGGHTRNEDATQANESDILAICKYTLKREIREEIGISLSLDDIQPFVIYTPTSEKSKKHLAICFMIKTDIDSLKLRLDSEELVTTKGRSKSGRFYPIKEIVASEQNNMELWSQIILKECFGIDIIPTTLFDI